MSKYLNTLALAGLSSAILIGFAQQPTPKVHNVPIQPTSVVSGQQMYTTYCVVCHGATGIGNGPAATALKVPPTNLALLSQKNNGSFPAAHVASVLEFGVENPAHGTAVMPIWGDLMLSLHPNSNSNATEMHQRVANLTNYLKQIQK
jgi:mono/diheme cytochrome c family protein